VVDELCKRTLHSRGLLLAVSVVTRPVVLAPLALRAPGTLNAARGGGSNNVNRRTSSMRAHSSTARARCRFESCERAHAPRQPRMVSRDTVGGCHGACASLATLEHDGVLWGN
jgi:hypothetical protein